MHDILKAIAEDHKLKSFEKNMEKAKQLLDDFKNLPPELRNLDFECNDALSKSNLKSNLHLKDKQICLESN